MQLVGKLGFLVILALAAVGMASFAGALVGDADGSLSIGGPDADALNAILSDFNVECIPLADCSNMDIDGDGVLDADDNKSINAILGGQDPATVLPKPVEINVFNVTDSSFQIAVLGGVGKNFGGYGRNMSGIMVDIVVDGMTITPVTPAYTDVKSGSKFYFTQPYLEYNYTIDVYSDHVATITTVDELQYSVIEMVDGREVIKSVINVITPISATYTFLLDKDNDTYNAAAYGGNDCDDANPLINPDAGETCNGIDDDCSGTVDDDLIAPLNTNQLGVCLGSVQSCGGVAGWADNYVGIATEEIAGNGIDEDCDGADLVADGHVGDGTNMVYGTWVSTICVALDIVRNIAATLTGGTCGLGDPTGTGCGYYLFNLIQPDTNCHISASKDGYDVYDSASNFDIGVGFRIEDVPLTENPFVAGHFTGTVLDDTTFLPISTAYVKLIKESSGEVLQVVKADADGNFLIKGVPTGPSYKLTAEATGCISSFEPTSSINPGDTQGVGNIWMNCS